MLSLLSTATRPLSSLGAISLRLSTRLSRPFVKAGTNLSCSRLITVTVI